MKEQSERSFMVIQKSLTVEQLLELYHYGTIFKHGSQQILSISDYDMNLYQPSEYYVQRRRGIIATVKANFEETEKNLNQSKIVKKSKVESIKKNNQPQIKLSRVSDKNLPQIKVSYIASKAVSVKSQKSQPDKTQVKSSKRKIQAVPPKKQQKYQYTENLNVFSLKQFQRPFIQPLNSNPIGQEKSVWAQKVHLSDFINNNKKETKNQNIQQVISTSKMSKTQRVSPINRKQSSSDRSEPSSYKKSVNQSPVVSYNKSHLTQSKFQYILPENYVSRNSKSKSKIKKPKQTSFAKKSPLKTFNKSLVQSYIIQPQKNQPKNQPISALISVKQNPKSHYNRPGRQINLKREDISPTQDFYDEPVSPQNQQYNHQAEIEQFQYKKGDKKNSYSKLQNQVKQTKSGQKAQYFYNKMDYFQIDIGPLNKHSKKPHKQSQGLHQISQDAKSKQQSAKPIQRIKLPSDKNSKASQQENPSKGPKTPRKKIFQDTSTKSIPDRSDQSDQIILSSLNDQQIKLLLGAKGNKYKQAIIFQYIKQNRKSIA